MFTLARKYQYKFAHFSLNNGFNHTFVVNMKHVISSKHKEFLLNTMLLPSNHFASYLSINFKGTKYKIGTYITNFTNEVCLYEIIEIIIIQNNVVSLIVHKIK